MSLLYNNYQKLVQQNDDAIAELSAESWEILKRMVTYMSSFSVSLFELEIIKKDLIGIAREAEIEDRNFIDKIGIPEKEFCDSLIQDAMKHSKTEHILPLVKSIAVWFMIFYTAIFALESFPQSYGITVGQMLLVALMTYGDMAGHYNLASLILGKAVYLPKNNKRIFLIFDIGTRIILLVIYGILPIDRNYFLIHGNGWMILVLLWTAGIASYLIESYYWNQCSKKYSWQ